MCDNNSEASVSERKSSLEILLEEERATSAQLREQLRNQSTTLGVLMANLVYQPQSRTFVASEIDLVGDGIDHSALRLLLQGTGRCVTRKSRSKEMHKGYEDDAALCEWLRENSSGNYRLAAHAAKRIEMLRAALVRTKIAANKARMLARGHECDCKNACMGIEQRAAHELGAHATDETAQTRGQDDWEDPYGICEGGR